MPTRRLLLLLVQKPAEGHCQASLGTQAPAHLPLFGLPALAGWLATVAGPYVRMPACLLCPACLACPYPQAASKLNCEAILSGNTVP